MKKVNSQQVLDFLSGFLESLEIGSPRTLNSLSNEPSISSFKVTPLPVETFSSSYRVSWRIQGAERHKVWFSILSCWGDLTFVDLNQSASGHSGFPCGALVPLSSAKGSLDLETRNWTGDLVRESFRIFAAGQTPVSRKVSLWLDPLPVIIAVDWDGKSYLYSDQPSEKCPSLVRGHNAEISGVAFLPKQTLWIGKTRVPVESTDGETITFRVPNSLPAGVYPMLLENAHGMGNTAKISVTD